MNNQSPRWFEQPKEFVARARDTAPETPDLWTRCPSCSELVFNETLVAHQRVCPTCDHHFSMPVLDRIGSLLDEGCDLEWHDGELGPVDALNFFDSKPYPSRIADARSKTGRNDAFVSVSGTIDRVEVELGCFDFAYMGGSMGSVVGEMITRLYERATERRRPAVVVSASGGARMQEGVLSLMQMAKTCAALARLSDEARMPYISVLTHPTTGGVAASFAMLGDVILAEPQALIGFAGPRVIEQTIGEELPAGFQRSEYLFEHGMIDRILHRHELPGAIGQHLRQLLRMPPLAHAERPTNRADRSDPAITESDAAKIQAAEGSS